MNHELLWTYDGEISNPEQAPITRSVWTCAVCFALVADPNLRGHERWHLTLATTCIREEQA